MSYRIRRNKNTGKPTTSEGRIIRPSVRWAWCETGMVNEATSVDRISHRNLRSGSVSETTLRDYDRPLVSEEEIRQNPTLSRWVAESQGGCDWSPVSSAMSSKTRSLNDLYGSFPELQEVFAQNPLKLGLGEVLSEFRLDHWPICVRFEFADSRCDASLLDLFTVKS